MRISARKNICRDRLPILSTLGYLNALFKQMEMSHTSSMVKYFIPKVQKEQNNCCRTQKRSGQPVDSPPDLRVALFFSSPPTFPGRQRLERKIKQIRNTVSALKQKCQFKFKYISITARTVLIRMFSIFQSRFSHRLLFLEHKK